MKKVPLGMVLTALLVIAIQVSAAPPRYPGSGVYHVVGNYGHPVAHSAWRGRYWAPVVGVHVGPGPGYGGAWNPGWRLGYGFPAGFVYPYATVYPYPLVSVPLVIDAAPITPGYIQKGPIAEVAPPMQPAPPVTYYYCTQPAGYFPYVQSCSQPWMKVNPQNPASPQ